MSQYFRNLLCRIFGHKIDVEKRIKVGQKILVDKGMLGFDVGELLSIDGYSIGGFFGTYQSNEFGEPRLFDQTVHKISLYDQPPTAQKEE